MDQSRNYGDSTFNCSSPFASATVRDISLAAVLRQQIAVERMILLAEECARAAVAALGDVVRIVGDDDARGGPCEMIAPM